MVERRNEEDAIVDQAALAEPLIAALADADADVRSAALWALLSLPLTAASWLVVGQHANAVLLERHTRSSAELLSVIEATPWIPVASTRDLVARIAGGELQGDEAVRIAAITALDRLATPVVESRPVEPAGFSHYPEDERRQLRQELSKLSTDDLWTELRDESSSTLPRRRDAVVVTMLMEAAGSAGDLESGDEVVRWVAGRVFMPDVEGLFEELVRLRRRFPRRPELRLARQIAWVVSRGGVIPLVAALHTILESTRREERLTALSLIQDAAAYMGDLAAPTDWGDLGVEPSHQEPAVRPRTDLVDEIASDRDDRSHDDDGMNVDDDVQFTLYRPSRVRPEVWHPVVAFAHRTEPIVVPGGGVMDPVEEVEQRAATLLSGLPTSYETVRADSDAGLPRGTDLLFEPWIETGEFNPVTQSLRWEEAIHEVHFRLRVPQSADGSRLRGGMRVFAGAMLIGDLTFRLSVSRDEPEAGASTERDTARRFRQIFASYSHRDASVVDAVERYVSVTGDRYLIDARTLRSGEIWDERLCQLIDEADIFQLFWSHNAMNSTFVRQEWEYALQLSREGFVRPVYWEDPLAEDADRNLPPTELRRIHFSRLRVDPAIGSDAGVSSDVAIGSATTGDASSVVVAPPASAGACVVCGSCGFVNEPDETFCVSCGSFLEWQGDAIQPRPSATSPSTRAPIPPPMGDARLDTEALAGRRPWRDTVVGRRWFSGLAALAIATALVVALVVFT